MASTSSHSPNTINSWSVIPWRNRDYLGISGWILLARVPRSANSPMCGGWYNRNAISVSSPGRCSRASLTASRPVRLVLARPFRNQGLSDHHTIVAERLDLAIKPVSHRPGFKADLQPVVPSASLLIVRSIGNGLFSTSPRNRTSPLRPPSATAMACFFLATSKATKTSLCFPMVRPQCMRLGSGLPKQPSFLTARKGGPPAQPREHDV